MYHTKCRKFAQTHAENPTLWGSMLWAYWPGSSAASRHACLAGRVRINPAQSHSGHRRRRALSPPRCLARRPRRHTQRTHIKSVIYSARRPAPGVFPSSCFWISRLPSRCLLFNWPPPAALSLCFDYCLYISACFTLALSLKLSRSLLYYLDCSVSHRTRTISSSIFDDLLPTQTVTFTTSFTTLI